MFSNHNMEEETFIEASCTNNMQTREKAFAAAYFQRFLRSFFLDRLKKLILWSYNLVCISLLYISREDKTKKNTVYEK